MLESVRRCVGAAFAAGKGFFARIDFRLELRMAPQMIEHRRLDAAETEIEDVPFHFRFGEMDGARIAVLGELVDYRTAGISQREHARDFVVGFASRVVARATESA